MSSEPITAPWSGVEGPDVSKLVTEDGAPVDNVYSERQMRLLVEPLYAGWSGPPPDEEGNARSFFAAANVGVFAVAKNTPLVPDVLVSVDVGPPADVFDKEHRSYFVWEYGKVPDVVIEVVSNKQGGEFGERKRRYATMRVPSYVVWDPERLLSDAALTVFALRGDRYEQSKDGWLEVLSLSLAVWDGEFEGVRERWLRWHDKAGSVLRTGAEHAETERARAETERARAETERARAETERARADALAARLKALGVEP